MSTKWNILWLIYLMIKDNHKLNNRKWHMHLRMSFIFCIFALKFVLSHQTGRKASKNRGCIGPLLGDY